MVIKVAGIVIAGVICSAFLKRIRPEISLGISMLAAIMIAGITINYLLQYKDIFIEMNNYLGKNAFYIKVLLKMIGITYVCEFCADLCKDAGYQSVAGQVYIFGKCIVLFSGIPILKALIDILLEFWN